MMWEGDMAPLKPLNAGEVNELNQLDRVLKLIIPNPNEVPDDSFERELVYRYFELRRRTGSL